LRDILEQNPMPKRKKKSNVKNLNEQIAKTVVGLVYLSETDAEIIPFVGHQTDSVTAENLMFQIGRTEVKIEEKCFQEFFAPLIKIQEWFGADERKMTEKFSQLKELLQTNLIQKRVFKLGKKELDIFVVGLDAENILRGIQTKATET
jgi:hypothetical protein